MSFRDINIEFVLWWVICFEARLTSLEDGNSKFHKCCIGVVCFDNGQPLIDRINKVSGNVYINQRDAQIIVDNLYLFVNWLYMFRTIISPSSGGTFNKLYSAIGTFLPVRLAAVWI